MLFSGRAYYNLLYLQNLRGFEVNAMEWEYLDYRALDDRELFDRIQRLHYAFDKDSFIEYCQDFDSPEELIYSLETGDSELKNKLYLLLFELWRRFLPQKKSISIFADELDRKIAAYESNKDGVELLLALEEVVEILESNTLTEEPLEAIFERFCLYVAHDLESVVYTYIDSKLKSSDEDYSIDLLDHFLPYVREKRALQFLRLKSLPIDYFEERNRLTKYLCESLQEKVNVAISLPFLFYLIESKDKEHFVDLFSSLIHQVEEEGALVSLLDVLVEYHRSFGREELEQKVSAFLEKGKNFAKASNKNIIKALLEQS